MKTDSIVDSAKKYLEECIATGSLRPGQQIKEQPIAATLRISRPPIREALNILEAEGLVFRKKRRGAFVSEITERDVWEIYTLKSALYDLGITLAFDRIGDEAIGRMEQIVREMEVCIAASQVDHDSYQFLNEQFHNVMFDIAGHKRLKKIVCILHNQIKPFTRISLRDEDHLENSFRYHRSILGAIRERDEMETRRLTREHIFTGLECLVPYCREQNMEAPSGSAEGKVCEFGQNPLERQSGSGKVV
jgi:DNA-binding GntR family transcriptional regulator